MSQRRLHPAPLTREAFAPYGDVIEPDDARHVQINDARFDRWVDLAKVDCGERVKIDMIRCANASTLPFEITLMERHPHGSQAFVPLTGEAFTVVVAPPGDAPDPAAFRAFTSDGSQGINMRPGVWHLPLVGFRVGQAFLVIDRDDPNNCDEVALTEPVILEAAP
ncbi:MAG: ureidoglycolate lyase [Pseudomonadota bacterium]